ncbi:MAG: GGDEF domain-containing protein [Gemmatimonadota bacterium]|nr:GGDEF domain-containing protein [Gemmatimonadota bacterium]
MQTDPLPTFHGDNAEILLWQSKVRYACALIIAAVAIALPPAAVLEGAPLAAGIGFLSYAVMIAGLTAAGRRWGARPWLLLAVSATDVVFLFGTAAHTMEPPHYERTLIFSFAIVHAAAFYFGRRLAAVVAALAVAGFIALVAFARNRGVPLAWGEEMWTMTAFLFAVGVFVYHYGSFRDRLTNIAVLFGRVEDGDFSGTYDVTADRRPDAVTAVGRAYNRVRGQLATMVLTDPLSGCLNRRGLDTALTREIARAVRSGGELSLIALDIDHFKRVNDCFGHLAGDAVIREMGALLRGVVRTADIVARLGGDEFAVLLPDTGAAGAFLLASRIRDGAAKRAFEGVTGRVPITVSIGVVSDVVTDSDMAHALHGRADEALYIAKAGGRNRVAIWTQGVKTPASMRAIALNQPLLPPSVRHTPAPSSPRPGSR